MKITKTLANIMLLSASMVLSQQGAAAPIDPEGQPLGYIGPMELSNTDLSGGGAKGYRGWFENGAWQGDLIEYDVSAGGNLSTSIDLSGPSPAQTTGANWSAHVTFAATADGDSHWNTGRKIIFSNNYGSNQKAFRWQNLDKYQKPALDNITPLDSIGEQSAVLNYLRGDRQHEGPTGGMRTRFTVLGDIIHSNPEYVGAPDGDFTDSDYITFKNFHANRAPTVYVGANDGMLHAFDASNGQERWAYVPSMLIPKLKRLAGRPYAHTYYVDGGITVRDAETSNDGWRTVLVGSLGAGGRGIFALDVTYPTLTSESAIGGNNDKIMWEERAENTPGDPAPGANPDVGYIFDASTIAKLNDGKWYAVFGNGIGSDTGEAVLMMKELRTDRNQPAAIKVRTGAVGDNGLSAPALVDTNGDGMSDIAWAGDINGDLWRFDLSGGVNKWTKAYKVYDGDPSQPITMAPDVANHPNFGHVVLFGTGKLFEEADLNTTATQALYGIWDTGTAPASFPLPLQAQTLSFNTDYDRFGFAEKIRTYTTSVTVDYNSFKGWKVELFPGERMLTSPQLRAGRLKTTIYNPNDGTNWLLEATFLNGNMADNSIYNLNQDTVLNEDDRVNANGNMDGSGNADYGDPEDIPMAWKRPDGNMSQPTIASLGAGVDTMFLNFLNPPIVESAVVPAGCTGNCVGGIEGGHIDLDHDIELGGGTEEHDHEYDDKVNRTWIDYLDLVEQHNINQDADHVANNKLFIPLISNADLNKGATLKIVTADETVEYNVVEYQKMIHQALRAWAGPPATLEDPEGNSLIFKMGDIIEMKMIFNSLAIISGGVHPTQTGCVKDNEPWRSINGRWRNGALTLHLVEKSHFNGLGTENALDRLLVQIPTDFQEAVYLTNGDGVALTEAGADGIVNGAAPDYEIFGGLRADPALEALGAGKSGFLYESTTFWHFNDDSSKCYGQPGWATDYYNASQQTVTSIFYEAFERTGATTLEELATIIDGLLAKGCATEGGGDSGDKDSKDTTTTTEDPTSCQSQYDQYTELYALGLLIEANGEKINCSDCLGDGSNGNGGGSGSGTSISGDPFAIVGGVNEGGITSGPNFEAGRRTWIDILPE